MEITVIIAVRNRETLLPLTLGSIAAQTRLPDHLIIVDNASTDNTAAVASEWARAHGSIDTTVISESIPGAAAARNAGLRAATGGDGSYVMFFDSDDLMHPGHLERVAKALAERPDTDLLYFDIAIRDSDGWTQVKSVPGDAPLIRSHIFHACISTQRYVARKSLIERAGGWDETLPRWNDYELGLRLAVEARSPRKLTGEPTVTVISHPDSITGTSYSKDSTAIRRALDAMRRTLAAAGLTQDLRYLRGRRAIVAALFAREGAADPASALLSDATEGAPRRDRAALRLIYMVTLLAGRGGAAAAAWLLAPPRPRRETRLTRNRH